MLKSSAVMAASSAMGRSLVPAQTTAMWPLGSAGVDWRRVMARACGWWMAAGTAVRTAMAVGSSARVARTSAPDAAMRVKISAVWSGDFPAA